MMKAALCFDEFTVFQMRGNAMKITETLGRKASRALNAFSLTGVIFGGLAVLCESF